MASSSSSQSTAFHFDYGEQAQLLRRQQRQRRLQSQRRKVANAAASAAAELYGGRGLGAGARVRAREEAVTGEFGHGGAGEPKRLRRRENEFSLLDLPDDALVHVFRHLVVSEVTRHSLAVQHAKPWLSLSYTCSRLQNAFDLFCQTYNMDRRLLTGKAWHPCAQCGAKFNRLQLIALTKLVHCRVQELLMAEVCSHMEGEFFSAAKSLPNLKHAMLLDVGASESRSSIPNLLRATTNLSRLVVQWPSNDLFSSHSPMLPKLRSLELGNLHGFYRPGVIDFLMAQGEFLTEIEISLACKGQSTSGPQYIHIGIECARHHSDDVNEPPNEPLPPFVAAVAAHLLADDGTNSIGVYQETLMKLCCPPRQPSLHDVSPTPSSKAFSCCPPLGMATPTAGASRLIGYAYSEVCNAKKSLALLTRPPFSDELNVSSYVSTTR